MDKSKLENYGFPEFIIENILQGKLVNVPYGVVKYDKKNSNLTTYYPDGRIKVEEL